MMILFASLLSGCATSTGYTNSPIPDLPSSVRSAGNTTIMPTGDVKKSDNAQLVARLRESELRNARAVNQCKAYHRKLQTLYGRNK